MSVVRPPRAHAAAALLLAVSAFVAAPASAHATAKAPVVPKLPVPTWHQASPGVDDINGDTAVLRTPDGVLHYTLPTADAATSTQGLVASTLGAGAVPTGVYAPVVAGWKSLVTPALVRDPSGGLRVIFSGLRSTDALDPYSRGTLYAATGDAAGSTWALTPGEGSISSSAYVSTNIGAAELADGTPVVGFAQSPGLFVHVGAGAGAGTTETDVATAAGSNCCQYSPNVVVDQTTGVAYEAFYANSSVSSPVFKVGQYVVPVTPSVGAPVLLPGSQSADGSDAFNPPSTRTPLVARTGGGVFTAYCQYSATSASGCGTAVLFRVDTAHVVAKVQTGDADQLALSNGGNGRLWLAWEDDQGHVDAVRTNPAATTVGAVVSATAPDTGSGSSIIRMSVEGSLGPLDVLAWQRFSPTGLYGVRSAELLPALTVVVKQSATKGKPDVVTVAVADAGAAVVKAKVTLLGLSATTTAKGAATIKVPVAKRGQKAYVVVKAPGFAPTSRLVAIK